LAFLSFALGCNPTKADGIEIGPFVKRGLFIIRRSRFKIHNCQELAYSRVAESSQGLLLWLDQGFTLYLSHLSIVNIITIVPPITACASSYDYQLLPQTHNLDTIKHPENMWKPRIDINLGSYSCLLQFAIHDNGIITHRIQPTRHGIHRREISQVGCEGRSVVGVVRIGIDGTYSHLALTTALSPIFTIPTPLHLSIFSSKSREAKT
jgi:hypothetical protein